MRLSLEMFVYLAFLVAMISGLPIPNDNNHSMIPFAIIPLAYSRWGRSRSEDRSLATGWRPIGWPHILGGTPANTSICRYPAQWDGKMWWIMCSAALALIVLYGVLAFAMWGIMSVDLPRLIVWNRTGEEWRRNFAGRVLKVRGRPNWMLCSLVVVSVAIGEILPLLFGHLFSGNSSGSFIMTNLVIIFSQVGPTFVMPVFHLEVIGRITWFIRLIMIFSAPAAVFPAYGLRRIKQWRKRGQPVHLEGLLPPNELIEFIRLHERSQGFGGMVEDHVGKAARNLLEQQISREDPSNGDLSSTHIGTEGTEPGQLTESIRSTVNQSLHEEESRTPDIESNPRPISIRSHCQEGSTAIEDAQVTGLRKREERSTEGHEPIITVTGVKVPEQAVMSVNNKHLRFDAPSGRPLQQDFALQDRSNSAIPPCRHRPPLLESYWNVRKEDGLVTEF